MDPERTRVIHRDLNRAYPTLVRGEGIYLYDDEGNRYIDGSGGSAAVTAIGHGVPEVVNALADQAAQLAYAPTHAFTTEAVESCARIIIEEFAPDGFGKVWFVSGGSEATENAVKMAIQYHRERGNGSRHVVIGRSPLSRLGEMRGDAGPSPRSSRPPSISRHAIRIAAARTGLAPSATSPAPTSSNTPFARSAPTMSPRSSPSRSLGPPSVRFLPLPDTSSASARSVTATACSSSPTR
jgi:hypothetical protein